MTDLDIQIDVPDDDGLNSPVRVLNGSSVPPGLKLAAFLLGVLAVLGVGAFLYGRSRAGDDEADGPATSVSAPLASAAATPAVNSSLEAVQAWESFARSGDLAVVAPSFDPAGPQYALFAAGAGAPVSDATLEFSARNLTEVTAGELTTVSLELVVDGARGQEVFPYDFVYRAGSTQVWTVVDRRSPGAVALPPSPGVIESATASWGRFTAAVAANDSDGAAAAVSSGTRELARQVAAVAAGQDPGAEPPVDAAVFDQLVARSRAVSSQGTEGTLLGLLDAGQRRALATGQLTTWTQVAPDRVVASLVVQGAPTATVVFVAEDSGWVFDLVGALDVSEGGSR